MRHTTLKQIRHDKWEDANGNYIYKDEFDQYIVCVNGTYEIAGSLESALNTMDKDTYWR